MFSRLCIHICLLGSSNCSCWSKPMHLCPTWINGSHHSPKARICSCLTGRKTWSPHQCKGSSHYLNNQPIALEESEKHGFFKEIHALNKFYKLMKFLSFVILFYEIKLKKIYKISDLCYSFCYLDSFKHLLIQLSFHVLKFSSVDTHRWWKVRMHLKRPDSIEILVNMAKTS